jgi:phage tail tape-measure protein
MAKIDKIINIKVEGVRRIKELEENLKKLRKQQRDNNKQSKSDAESYSQNSKAIKSQSKELRDLKKAMSGANDAAKKSNRLQKSMTMGVIQGAAAFSILVTAFRRVNQALTSMIGTFTDFEFTMAKVKAVSGANAEEFKLLSDQAQHLGRTTFFTAAQVAELQLNLST